MAPCLIGALLVTSLAAGSVNAFHIAGMPLSSSTSSTQVAQRASMTAVLRHRHFGLPDRKGGSLAVTGEAGEEVGGTAVITAEGQQALEILRQAVETRKTPAGEVSEALEGLAEAEETGLPAVIAADDVEGTWELVFSTQLASGYMPVKELIGFHPSSGEVSINTTFGPLPIGGMRGKCWWKGGIENELAFSMDAMQFGPLKIARDNADVKTYQFFLHQGSILAAKSSAGGFALLSQV